MLTQENRNHEKLRLINLLASYGIREPVLSAFDEVPRELFISRQYAYAAYEDHPIRIGEGQTTSQPSLIALMLQELELQGREKVLEVGTGSGFQTALLSKLAREVYSIEIVKSFVAKAKKRIGRLGLKNVSIVHGDGSQGLPEHAPYDAIIVTAYFREVPKPLVEQLKEGGRLIMPVGGQHVQEVTLFRKRERKLKEARRIVPVVFVPLVGKYGVKK